MVLDARRLAYSLYVEWADSLKTYYDAWFDGLIDRHPQGGITLRACQRRCHMALETYKAEMRVPLMFSNRSRRLEVSQQTGRTLQAVIRDVMKAVARGRLGASAEAKCASFCAATAQHFAVIDELVDRWVALLMEVQGNTTMVKLQSESSLSA